MSAVREKIDVAIVGAGAAGALMAAKLAGTGKSVVVLEAGPRWSPADLISSTVWSRRLHWGGERLSSEGADPLSVAFNLGWGLGGSSLHHFGVWPRLKPEDFKVRTLYGRGLDWPIDYEELRPFYDTVQDEVGLSGDTDKEVWRPQGAQYPMPPLRTSRQASAITRGFTAVGKRVAPAPLAINSTVYNGRAACMYDGWCNAGCPIGALANPLVTYIRAAETSGASIVPHAPVLRVVASHSDRVDGIEYRDPSGATVFQPARVVILAASAVGNPAILLRSASEHHPQGVGNANDLVGRRIMTHALMSVMGLLPEDTEPHLGVSGALLICHDDYGKTSTPEAFGSRQWLIGPSMKPMDFARFAPPEMFGRRLDSFVRRATRHGGLIYCMSEELPQPDNRVELKAGLRSGDLPAATIKHRFCPDAVALAVRSREEGRAIFKAAGANSIIATPVGSAHLMGGTPMGTDPQASVTDSYGYVHGVENLLIAGAGLFPTVGAVNPTFTLCALALRTASYLLAQWPGTH